jgi:Zn ribbon nucleic-acid-binding protein
MYKPINKLPMSEFYAAFEIAADDDLLLQWSTPEQREFNAAHTTCPTCEGRGYATYWDKNSRTLVRECIGCDTCLGTGSIKKVVT